MAYEYRSGSQSFELPNPYAVENRVRFAVGAALAAAGTALLFLARARLGSGWNAASLLPLAGGVGLLAYGVHVLAVGMRQLRFFFGRERPNSLAQELPPDQQGASKAATELQEMVRRGALHFEEPKGAVNGVLYSWQRNLIYAVAPLQRHAQAQFRIAAVVLAILVSFAVSCLLVGGSPHAQWLGLLYFALTVFVVLQPMRHRSGQAPDSDMLPVALVAAAILGPVAMAFIAPALPSLGGIRFLGATLCALLFAGVGATLFFLALRAQLGEPPPVSSSMHQLAVSMNCHPSQLMDELARRLLEKWREQIPNRRYAFAQPQINLAQQASGSFGCDLLEETQPFPARRQSAKTIAECLKDAQQRWVLYLQLYGAALVLASALLVVLGAWFQDAGHALRSPSAAVNILLFASAGLFVGLHCLRGAHALFGRFDFESVLYWFECRGNYQVAALDYGNVLSDSLKTHKNLVNVETATLRVWVVELYSVVFGKDEPRLVRAMVGRKDEAQLLAESLAAFAQEQSSVVAPTARQDAQKMEAMARFSASPTRSLSVEQAAALLDPTKPAGGDGS
jgi:hypothetical protein